MATRPIVEGENRQVTIYHSSGAVSTAQEGRREGESQSELDRRLAEGGWSLTPQGGGTAAAAEPGRTESEGYEVGKAMFAFLPEDVLKEFSKAWVKSGDPNIAIGSTRQTKAWKDSFGKLMRPDGSLVMDEISFLSVKASYRQTLAEVGIQDFSDFEDEFTDMATGYETGDPVSGSEFQQRIDRVWSGVKEQIPEVEKLFRERYDINVDAPTIFGALVNDKIQDKVLKGDIATLQLQAEASSRGFSTTFSRFEQLRKQGLTKEAASGLYEQAGGIMEQARSVGRNLQLETLEDAALGDAAASRQLRRIQAEVLSQGGATFGAAKKGDEVTGLISD